MIGVSGIKRILPHRYPMLLLDRVVDVEPGSRLTALKAVTANEPWYRDLPEDAVDEHHEYPSVLLVESWCQAAAVLGLEERPVATVGPARVIVVAQVSDVEFRDPVLPGDVVEHRVRTVHGQGDTMVFAGESMVGDAVVMTVGAAILLLRSAESLRGTVATESALVDAAPVS